MAAVEQFRNAVEVSERAATQKQQAQQQQKQKTIRKAQPTPGESLIGTETKRCSQS
jgi:hypothetical protein